MLDLDQMINDVELAIHRYYMGEQVVRVKIEGEESEYNRTNIDKLEGYLSRLKARKAGQAQSGSIGFIW